MPSQSRAFEASFESSGKQQVPHGSDPERMLEDFDTFFEKINSLDQADWRNAHPANPERPAMQASATAEHKASGKVDPLAGLRAAVAQAKQGGTDHGGAGRPARFPRLHVAGPLRFALLALVLFVVGMGIGWAALSLPGRSGSDAPATALTAAPEPGLFQEAKGAEAAAAPLAATASKTDATAKEVLLSEVPGQATEMMASSTSAPKKGDEARATDLTAQATAAESTSGANGAMLTQRAADRSAGASPSAAKTRAASVKSKSAKAAHSDKPGHAAGTVQTGKAVQTPTAVQTGNAVRTAKAVPAKAVQQRTSPQQTAAQQTAPRQPLAEGAAGTVQGASGEAHYAVQVGACRSPRCVDSYRQLVTAHMQAGADPTHIVTVPGEGKDASMQRVRVAPLDKAAAQRLKDTLVQADARLRGAYVVELRP